MPINSGRYIITNVQQRNLATLPDPNDGTPLAAGVRKRNLYEQWLVQLQSNRTYSIRNVMHENVFANVGDRAKFGAMVEGRNIEQYWLIEETHDAGRYTICPTDVRLFWALEVREVGTPITLLAPPTDQRCWWTFEDAGSGAVSRGMQRDYNSNSGISTPHPFIAGQPTPNGAVILPGTLFKISESRGLLDPLAFVSKALERVLSAARERNYLSYMAKLTLENMAVAFEEEEEWKTPIRRLTFHLHTIKYHYVELEKDFKIDGIVPTPDMTIIGPLEKYANDLRVAYQLICANGPVHSSLLRLGNEQSRNEEIIGQMIRHLDFKFEEYTAALHSFAEQTYKALQELPQAHQNLGAEVVVPHYAQFKRINTHGVQHKECLPGTRIKTLNAIREWIDDTSGAKPTFLLLDVAGSGKSTVAKTMAEELWSKRLVARYFFSRDTTATRSTKSFCSTVSEAFVRLAPALKTPVEAFKTLFDLNDLSFKELFNGLVRDPLEKLSLDAILIIDALDECDDEDGSCTDLLNAIYSQRPSTPRLRILATGRPELHITDWAQRYGIQWCNFFRLEGNNNDVDLYIEQTLQNLPGIHATVIGLANGVFIWARIACDLIRKTDDVNRILKELEAAVSLDYLYQVALNQSVPKDEGSRRVFAVVLQMILSSRSPLSIAELDKLAPEPHIVERVVTRLGALLVYQSREDPIRLLHATFREFLTVPSKADRYLIQLGPGHHTLTFGCLNYITQHETGQKASTLSRSDDISERVYVYSSKSWVHHCIASYRKLAMDPQILEFSNTCLQTWAYNADEWGNLDTISCLRDVILLSHQGMITETAIDKSLETASSDHYP